MINPFQPLSHVVVKFFLEGKEYEVENFKIGFSQATDHKGQPQHETKGGQIYLTLAQKPDDNLYDWAKRSTKLKDGRIAFQTQMSNPVLDIEFSNAYCLKLSLDIDAFSGTKCGVLISPETVIVNGVTHNNAWKK